MPTVRKLSPAEVAPLQRPRAPLDLTPYAEGLRALDVGDWGLIELAPGDTIRTMKRRFTIAAKQQGKRLIYKRPREGAIPFEVRALASGQPTPPPTVAPPVARRGRRRS